MLDFSVTFIITIINIVILTIILRAVLFKPVTKFMAERSRRIQNSIEQAETEKAKAQKLLEQYEKRIESAEKEAEMILRAAQEQADTEAERIISKSRHEAEKISEAERAKLYAERLAAMALFKAEASALVLKAAGAVLGRELQGAEQQRYAAEALERIALSSDYSGTKDV